jgi:hypothetical protein
MGTRGMYRSGIEGYVQSSSSHCGSPLNMSIKESTPIHPPDHQISDSENSDQESDVASTGSPSARIITPPVDDDDDDTYMPKDGDSDSAEGSHSFSDRTPEDCWGDLDYDCPLCESERMFCPGCTG